eukprot:scaffold7526_cov115-Skeletonema_dohrnii-CCMP3373.AAC.3
MAKKRLRSGIIVVDLCKGGVKNNNDTSAGDRGNCEQRTGKRTGFKPGPNHHQSPPLFVSTESQHILMGKNGFSGILRRNKGANSGK